MCFLMIHRRAENRLHAKYRVNFSSVGGHSRRGKNMRVIKETNTGDLDHGRHRRMNACETWVTDQLIDRLPGYYEIVAIDRRYRSATIRYFSAHSLMGIGVFEHQMIIAIDLFPH